MRQGVFFDDLAERPDPTESGVRSHTAHPVRRGSFDPVFTASAA